MNIELDLESNGDIPFECFDFSNHCQSNVTILFFENILDT